MSDLSQVPDPTLHAVAAYLDQCRVRNPLAESTAVHVPPSATEVKGLIQYLGKLGIAATIIGSVGVLYHIKDEDRFRPTVDLDLFVNRSFDAFKAVRPPGGWVVDTESPGVISWISPSGGYVDFMTQGHQFPSGETTPKAVRAHAAADKAWPVAAPEELFKLKLNSMREKDLTDLIALARAIGRVPDTDDLGPLNQTQRDNLDLVRQWFKVRPMGRYGE